MGRRHGLMSSIHRELEAKGGENVRTNGVCGLGLVALHTILGMETRSKGPVSSHHHQPPPPPPPPSPPPYHRRARHEKAGPCGHEGGVLVAGDDGVGLVGAGRPPWGPWSTERAELDGLTRRRLFPWPRSVLAPRGETSSKGRSWFAMRAGGYEIGASADSRTGIFDKLRPRRRMSQERPSTRQRKKRMAPPRSLFR